jgi:hypothetical protein
MMTIKLYLTDGSEPTTVVEPMVFRGESEKTEIEKWKMFIEVEEVIDDAS